MANRLDAITNGVLWSLSSALGLRSVNIVPAASTGIIAGAVPSSLELAALQIPVRKRISKTPSTNMLSFVFDLPSSKDYYLPNTVRRYLKSVPPGKVDIRSRREQLRAAWHSTGSLPPETSRKYKKWIKLVTGTYDNSVQSLSKDALEQRMLMLNHLKVTIFTMKRGLFELTNAF